MTSDYQVAFREAVRAIEAVAGKDAVVPLVQVTPLLPDNPEWTAGIPKPRRRRHHD